MSSLAALMLGSTLLVSGASAAPSEDDVEAALSAERSTSGAIASLEI